MLARALDGGLDRHDAVAVIVDQRDPLGGAFALAAAEKAGLDASREAGLAKRRGQIPTTLIVVNVGVARVLFSETHPNVASGLATRPGLGRVRVVVIAEGAAMLVHSDVAATSPRRA